MTDNQHDEGLHDCARGERCSARKSVVGDDGKYVIVPGQTYRVYCDADVTRIRNCLNDLPRRYVELTARIGDKPTHTLDGPRVSGGGAAPPIPINTGVDAFQQQIVEVVTSWEERVREAARLTDVSGNRRAGHAVKVAAAVLAAHVEVLLALPPDSMYRTCDITRAEHVPDTAVGYIHDGWVGYNDDLSGAEAGVEILSLHHRCLARLGWTPQHQDLITPCWDCGERKLRRHDGSVGLADHIECLSCRSEYLGSRLRALMVDEEQARQRKATRERRRAASASSELQTRRTR